jgi:PadR family transcriptional regulator, regulatory protein PadR
VPRDRVFSEQTLSVLATLSAQPHRWQHGYGIARETGLKSGTLYPVLIRLTDRGLLEACWEDDQPVGRPRRHLYRLTTDGLATAREALAERPARAAVSRRRQMAGRIAPSET